MILPGRVEEDDVQKKSEAVLKRKARTSKYSGNVMITNPTHMFASNTMLLGCHRAWPRGGTLRFGMSEYVCTLRTRTEHGTSTFTPPSPSPPSSSVRGSMRTRHRHPRKEGCTHEQVVGSLSPFCLKLPRLTRFFSRLLSSVDHIVSKIQIF